MSVSKAMLEEVKANAFHDEKGQAYFTEAISSVLDILENYPPSIMCMVGETIANEGAYRLLLKMEEGEKDWKSWHKTFY